MIYLNFLYLIIAISLFSTIPASENALFSLPQALVAQGFILWVLWFLNKSQFGRIGQALHRQDLSVEEASRYFSSRINIQIVITIFCFAVEIFVFDLKGIFTRVPLLGLSETFVNLAGMAYFLLQLAFIWYWGFRSMGDTLDIGRSAGDYIRANVKFNLAIVVPWLLFTLLLDLLSLIAAPAINRMMDSALFQVGLFALFLVIMVLFTPLLVTYLWDCKPLQSGPLREAVLSLCREQNIAFREIMSWDALNRGLLTAGVMGLFRRSRYLLLTPRLTHMLNQDELLGVVSHEIGHVKKKHLFYYMLFFLGFLILSMGTIDRSIKLFINSRLGFSLLIGPDGAVNVSSLSFFSVFISLFLFVFYFRFIFGYFMRNFERQADAYCFKAGIDPRALISSFMKLGVVLGDDGNKSNWHHYNIAQRIDFLQRCVADPQVAARHDRKVKRMVKIFVLALVLFTVLIFNPYASRLDNALDYRLMANVLQERIAKEPANAQLYMLLGVVYYQEEKWALARKAYETSLELNYSQPEVLNNLAWLLVKCPDRKYRDYKRSLELAEEAVKLAQSAHIYDTLAEGYLANGQYKEAVAASARALQLADEDREYLENQLEKMKKLYLENKSVLRI